MKDTGTHGEMTEVLEALAPDRSLLEDVVSARRVWQGRIFSVDTLEVELSDGSRGAREIVRHNGGAAVVAIRDGRVCLVRQYRVALGRVTLEIPAGKLEHGEDGAGCAARELYEETGLRAETLEPLVTTLGSPGFTNEHTEVFVARGLSQDEASPDEGEFVDVAWLPVDAVVSAIRAGVIQDAKTVAGVLATLSEGAASS
jgi:ADP-ribose pyrophosphatase